MALINTYVQPINRIPDLFGKIKDGQVPERFTQQLLKDWGFASTNDRAFVPLLKALGFLTADGKPTERYREYRDHSKSKTILGQALRESYSDIFLIKEHPTQSDRPAVEGKFKSFHSASDNVAGLMAKTFYGLLQLADLTSKGKSAPAFAAQVPDVNPDELPSNGRTLPPRNSAISSAGLHYNIQIHLPATKDVEVYNAIFKSLKEHLIE